MPSRVKEHRDREELIYSVSRDVVAYFKLLISRLIPAGKNGVLQEVFLSSASIFHL
jgi:hypothetical protein